MEDNPYNTPDANVRVRPDDDAEVQKIISGQKLILYAILLNIGANILAARIPMLGVVAFLVAAVMAITGLAKVCTGLRYHIAATVIFCVLMIVPLLNLVVLVLVNRKATARIREAGYEVGLMGAKV